MSTNIYEFSGTLLVCGSCMPRMDSSAFEKVKELSDSVYFVCLESMHMNMVAHKLASVLRVGKVDKLIFCSVDKSPHCVQLHYISSELKKIMDLSGVEMLNYVANSGELIKISTETISRSKNLCLLETSE